MDKIIFKPLGPKYFLEEFCPYKLNSVVCYKKLLH